MEHWHDCETYRQFGFQCPAGLHGKKKDREQEVEPSEDELAEQIPFPWDWLLPARRSAQVGDLAKGYFVDDADADKIRRFPAREPARLPDIPEDLAALITGAALLLLLRGSLRSIQTARAAERVAVSAMAAVPVGGRSAVVGQMIGGSPRTGTVRSPIGGRESGPGTVRRKKRKELEGRGELQAGQFQSFGEWWYQGVDQNHVQNFFRGSERFDPANVPSWIRTAATRAAVSSLSFGSGFNEQWLAEFGQGGAAPFAAGPGN